MSLQQSMKIQEVIDVVNDLLKEKKINEMSSFLDSVQFEEESLAPYRHFMDAHYTRNLIFKNELFEMLALCWGPGHRSWIHNHQGQHCWMAVSEGRLAVRNYRRVGCSQQERVVELDPLPQFVISTGNAAVVDPTEPIHLVWNPEEWSQPAVSIHVYSLPYDTCVIYDADHGQCRNVRLFYTSKYGRMEETATEKSDESPFCVCSLSPEEQVIHCGPTAAPRS